LKFQKLSRVQERGDGEYSQAGRSCRENGSGKSTFFDVFTFLKVCPAQNVAKAVAKRGGFKELVSRGAERPISIIPEICETGGRLATYELSIASEAGGLLWNARFSSSDADSASTLALRGFFRGRGTAITNERCTASRESR